MKQKQMARPRNRLVALALFKSAGVHRKSNKALRREQNMRDRSSKAEQEAFNFEVVSSSLTGPTI